MSVSVTVATAAAATVTPPMFAAAAASLLFGKVEIFPLCAKLQDPLLLRFEAFPGRVFVDPGLNVQHASDDLLSKVGREVVFVLDDILGKRHAYVWTYLNKCLKSVD